MIKINNQIIIDMSADDIKNAIIKYLYREQKISGIFNVHFKIVNQLETCILDSATIIVDLNANEQ